MMLTHLLLLAAALSAPSRPPFEHCKWQKLSDRTLGLEAWVQRCTSPKTKFIVKDHALVMRSTDFPEGVDVIRFFDLRPGETPTQGLRRIFDERTDKKLARRCVLAPFEPASKRAGVKRYTFVPDEAYQKEVDAQAQTDVGAPPEVSA